MFTNFVSHVVTIYGVIFVYPSAAEMEGNIVGGIFSNINKFPHSVFLQVACGSSWICGSSVLNQDLLLTAGHCIEDCDLNSNNNGSITVYAGHENLKKVSIVRKAKQTLMHRFYNSASVTNDIGMVRLVKGLPLGQNVQRIIISRRALAFPITAAIAGWGLENDATRAQTLQLKSVDQSVQAASKCLRVGKMHPGMMCAGTFVTTSARPSEGDSGSALIDQKHQQQIGILSFRTTRFPALLIYSNLTYYYGWIFNNAKTLYCS